MQRYQIVQRSIDRVEVLVLPGVGITPDLPGAIRTALRPVLHGLEPEVRLVDEMPPRAERKFRIVRSELHGPHRHRPMAERRACRGAIPRLLARPAATAVATDPGLWRGARAGRAPAGWARRRPGGASGPAAYGTWSLLRVSQHYLVIVGLGTARGPRSRRRRIATESTAGQPYGRACSPPPATASSCSATAPSRPSPPRLPSWRRTRSGVRSWPALPRPPWSSARSCRVPPSSAQGTVPEFAAIEPRPRRAAVGADLGAGHALGLPGAILSLALAYAGGLAMMRGRVPMRIGRRGPPSAT